MQLWTPSREEPELLAWWGALLMVARHARRDRVPWPVHLDQFDLLGRVDRSGSRAPVWIYRHRESGGDIYADPTGQTYRYRLTPNASGPGRFDGCELRAAIHLAGLPEVVEPLWEQRCVESPPEVPEGEQVDVDEVDEALGPPAARGRSHHRPTRSRVRRQDRWLHAVPALA